MTTYTYAAVSTWPKVIVVGDPRLGDLLASCGAEWIVQPVSPTISGMWDGIESGTLDSESHILVVTDGTASQPDELEATLAAFAPFADTFVIASPERGQAIVARAQGLAPTVQNGDPTKPIWVLPVHDVNQALDMMRHVLASKVTWTATGTPLVTAPVAPVHRPQTPSQYVTPEATEMVAPVRHHIDDMQAQATGFGNTFTFEETQQVPGLDDMQAPAAPSFTPTSVAPAHVPAYEQAQVYSDAIVAQAQSGIAKNPNAIPGQVTIACMSSKGGSGKSTTALCLAGMIAKASAAAGQPKRVVLVDLDTRDGQVGSLIGQYMPTSINIRVMPKWDAATVKANLVHDKRLGIDALLAPVRPRNADDVGPDFYRHILSVLQTTHDIVVLDCSVNYLDPLLGTAFQMSDEILFVTTLATTSVQGMARSLTELFADPSDGGLGIPREKVGIVANQVINNVGMGKDKLLRAALGAPLVGQIPADQDAVLIATNSNRMSDLLKHPKLGPAYFRLASNCLPAIPMAPLTAEQAQTQQAPQQQAPQPEKKKGLFGR